MADIKNTLFSDRTSTPSAVIFCAFLLSLEKVWRNDIFFIGKSVLVAHFFLRKNVKATLE
ncbi:hypothetical protein [Aggregatibacter kilianii]|uniref:hypothetical protein n=1 Tax=Aggregatibacter kilianii TaxID=2025884 RepID=UPI000D656841|nr:hypothetical protein [Aggregatibacter kilianii]